MISNSDLPILKPPFKKELGAAWVAQLPDINCSYFSSNTVEPKRSLFRLYEDNKEIGMPNQEHKDIREKGCGRYSHWRESLIFSTPDGSDPNTNGHEYRLDLPQKAHSDTRGACQDVIYILGAAYSGSTLLNLMLGSHPKVYGGGELYWLPEYRYFQKNAYFCSTCQQNCKIWTKDFVDSIPEIGFYDHIASQFNSPMIVDSSKNVNFLKDMASLNPQTSFKVILLTKNIVRHVSSFVEKGKRRKDIQFLANPLNALITLNEYYIGIRDISIYHTVQYESLVSKPEATLRTLCERIGLEFHPAMLNPFNQEHHYIGGNQGPMRQLTGRAVSDEFTSNKYKSKNVFLDDTYKTVLSAAEITVLEEHAITHALNARFSIGGKQ